MSEGEKGDRNGEGSAFGDPGSGKRQRYSRREGQ